MSNQVDLSKKRFAISQEWEARMAEIKQINRQLDILHRKAGELRKITPASLAQKHDVDERFVRSAIWH